MIYTNYLIINRKPQSFNSIRIAGKIAVFLDDEGRPLDNGVLPLGGDSVYAALYCDEVFNVTLVTDRRGSHDVVTILWRSAEEYHEGFRTLSSASPVRFSRQEKRINRYAESIAEKLDEGVRLRVTDAVDESAMLKCPDCGMLNPPGSMYCLDCGAEL